MKPCFQSADILLPKAGTDLNKWAVSACDQYTSCPEYWAEVEGQVNAASSSLHLIYPEVYLEEERNKLGTNGSGCTAMDERIHSIHRNMDLYLREKILTEQVTDGFVLVVRKTCSGTRVGLVGVVDLEQYEYEADSSAPVRATERTITERIPPRMKIREDAPLETSHVMLLIDDREKRLVEPLYEKREKFRKLYETELMKDGGYVQGYAITGEDARDVEELLQKMQEKAEGPFLAAGDGNHSLASAKEYWRQIKGNLSERQQEDHPARYALAELVNVHSPALIFEPIHRVVFGAEAQEVFEGFQAYLRERKIPWHAGTDIVFLRRSGEADSQLGNGNVEGDAIKQCGIALGDTGGILPLDVLQKYLDCFVEAHPGSRVDYVHGEQEVRRIAGKPGRCGLLLGAMDKQELFPAIAAGGTLPRKTFSLGEAQEKRYYMECRKIRNEEKV